MRTLAGWAAAAVAAVLLGWAVVDDTPWQAGVFLGIVLAAFAVGALTPPQTTGRRRRLRRGERSFRVEAWIPLSAALHGSLAPWFAEHELADGFVYWVPLPEDPDVVAVSWLVIAKDPDGALDQADRDLEEVGLIHDGIRVRPRDLTSV